MNAIFAKSLSRRRFLAGSAVAAVAFFEADVIAREVMKEIHELKPGEFTWHPERQPHGAVAVIVSLPEQLVHVYRNGIRIAASTCSTGKKGHSTPTGVFVVLQKDKHHRSSTYNNAPMPNMNRLTWSGIALHAGKLPGYPASHGCVRLPLEFSEKLFTITHLGTPVIISGAHSDPRELKHPGMVLSGYAEHEFEDIEATLQGKKHPKDWTEADIHPVTSVIASSADHEILLIENGDVLAKGKLTIKGGSKLGSHVYTLQGAHGGSKGLHWVGVSHNQEGTGAFGNEEGILTRLTADHAFVTKMGARMHPGMVMVLTDAPLHPDTRSGKDFVIMS